ncbi:hypothetical protein ACJIZ3_023565 [Penstemon smallii]|uniref:Uncharacterized protein n=1 Tax=Penstemon smallii TaxID=265156 RepID=A0ABD3TPE7_9LAMI
MDALGDFKGKSKGKGHVGGNIVGDAERNPSNLSKHLRCGSLAECGSGVPDAGKYSLNVYWFN